MSIHAPGTFAIDEANAALGIIDTPGTMEDIGIDQGQAGTRVPGPDETQDDEGLEAEPVESHTHEDGDGSDAAKSDDENGVEEEQPQGERVSEDNVNGEGKDISHMGQKTLPTPTMTKRSRSRNPSQHASSMSAKEQKSTAASTPGEGRSMRTREKHTDYKALLAGPSITRKLVPPKKPGYNEKGQRVWCICRQPDSGKFMIQCDNCSEWFHGSCVGLTKKAGEKLTTYTCPPCSVLISGANHQPPGLPSSKKAQETGSQVGSKGPSPKQTSSRRASKIGASRDPTPSPVPESKSKFGDATHDHSEKRPSTSQVCSTKCAHKPCLNSAKGTDIPENKAGTETFCSTACANRHVTAERSRIEEDRAAALASAKVQGNIPPSQFFGVPIAPAGSGSIAANNIMTSLTPIASAAPPKLTPPAWTQEPVRRMARKGFLETFTGIFAEAKENTEDYADVEIKVNLEDPQAFVAGLEEAMYEAWATPKKNAPGVVECAEPYKNKYRSLQFNLKDKANLRLRRLVVSGDVTPEELVRLAPQELANDQVQAAAAEYRRKALREAIRVNTEPVGVVVKKTHKGDIEVVRTESGNNLMMDEGMPISAVSDFARSVDDEGSNTPLSSSVKSPWTPDGADTDSEDQRSSDLKREKDARDADEADVDRASKRARLDLSNGDGDSISKKEVAMDVVDSSPTATNANIGTSEHRAVTSVDHSPADADAATEREDDDGEAPRTELILEGDAAGDDYGYGAYDYDDPTTADGNPMEVDPILDLGPTDLNATVWTGRIHMPQVAKFTASCRQVGGRLVGGVKTWEDLLPATISIDGRVAPNVVEKYLREQRFSGGKQVVVVEILPPGEGEGANGANALKDATADAMDTSTESMSAAANLENYNSLFNYFRSRNRWAVVGHHYVSIKDMYFSPLGKDDPIPPCIADLDDHRLPEAPREADKLYGVIILSKDFGGGGHVEWEVRDREKERNEQRQRRSRTNSETEASVLTLPTSSASAFDKAPSPPKAVAPALPPAFASLASLSGTNIPGLDPAVNMSPITPASGQPKPAPSKPSLLDTYAKALGQTDQPPPPLPGMPSDPRTRRTSASGPPTVHPAPTHGKPDQQSQPAFNILDLLSNPAQMSMISKLLAQVGNGPSIPGTTANVAGLADNAAPAPTSGVGVGTSNLTASNSTLAALLATANSLGSPTGATLGLSTTPLNVPSTLSATLQSPGNPAGPGIPAYHQAQQHQRPPFPHPLQQTTQPQQPSQRGGPYGAPSQLGRGYAPGQDQDQQSNMSRPGGGRADGSRGGRGQGRRSRWE
ncbi:uncharacterized protein EV422DRAFT_513808 [Fimicolochytrium jonesii]|uniref:uncharacterized protein n=1 Tax=Fimicolochytrium jonesii TaxID=1396493 RepID=UPI0022FF3A57|nr:uncharacterized protein EV422DRAFT_513808 [Fimicolochytrium jonesii]KAI8825675.1 hypothetical protein EV422DRAFT_513808 [Fimicolochytrium jonesii]